MWSSYGHDRRTTCPACGRTVPRSAAREYDKFGDRWARRGKTFEHLCTRCHEELCHQRRDGLEALLIDLGAGECDDEEFLRRYVATVGERESVDG